VVLDSGVKVLKKSGKREVESKDLTGLIVAGTMNGGDELRMNYQ